MGIETAIMMGVSAAAQGYQAKRAGDKQARALNQQGQAQAADLEFRKQMYGDSQARYGEWKEMFWPILQDIIAEADQDASPDYEAIGADNRAAFSTAMESTSRDLERRGLDLSDPRYATVRHGSRLAEAASLVGNRNRAREDADGQRLRNLSAVYALGSGMQGSALQSLNSTGALVASGHQNQASHYGNMASQYGDASAAGWANFASFDWAGALDAAFQTGSTGGGVSTIPQVHAGGYGGPPFG